MIPKPEIDELQQLLATARADFWREARPLITSSQERQSAEGFARAIGEVSPPQALEGFRTWLEEHRRWTIGPGDTVCFHSDMPDHPGRTVIAVTSDGLVELKGFSGRFGKHLFRRVEAP